MNSPFAASGSCRSFLRRHGLALLAAVMALTAMAGRSAAAGAPKPDAPVTFEFALYFSPKPSADPMVELNRLLADPSRRLTLPKAPNSASAVAIVMPVSVALADYAPPTADALRYTSVGVDPSEAPKLAAAERVFILRFITPRLGALVANRAACVLLADLARATNGRIWDEETRQLYSLEQWQTKRVETWQGNLPDMSAQVTLHAYANPELVRIITLGMRKFGLPDLVVSEIPHQHTRPFGNFLNALMQRLVEGQRPENSTLLLNLSEIRHAKARASALTNPGKGAKGIVLVSTRAVPLEPGDNQNLLWRLDFPEAKLDEVTERAMWGANELFGSTDSIVNASANDAELAAARTRARKAFFAQEARFRAGLAFKEHLLVKAPFVQSDQTEYMWVEVTSWGVHNMEGLLTSDPYYVKDLHAGSRVMVPLDEVYDYIFYHADGTEEGNETGKILEQREKK